MLSKSRPLFLTDILLPALVAVIALAGSLALGLLAPPGATRVAVLALPGASAPWAAINRSGLPVVQMLLGGVLVVVDGSGAPGQMALLRGAPVVLLDAKLVPGCTPVETSASERGSDGPDA